MIRVIYIILFLMLVQSVRAIDYANGQMQAMPVKYGKAPVIDGNLEDWDLSAQEPVYISVQTVRSMHAEWAVMYDREALYLSAQVSLPNRPYRNPANPQDGYWWADCLQARLSCDPQLPYPLDKNRDKDSNRVCHLGFWKNSETGKDYVNIAYGTRLNLGSVTNPDGVKSIIKSKGNSGYVLEAKIPWSILNAKGNVCPFRPGEYGGAVFETLWIGGDSTRVSLNNTQNVGVFSFHHPESWGRLIFAADSPKSRIRPSIEEIISENQFQHTATKSALTGVPIELVAPGDDLKVSVNIFDANGRVIREVIGGMPCKKGSFSVHWDGRDAFGKSLDPGKYRWGAYFHRGLKAEYQGGVGSSGNPYYNTLDERGAWGGDHTHPIGVAADSEAFYFLWPVAEAGKALLKISTNGKVIWRKSPYVGGGFGPFTALALDAGYVYLLRQDKKGACLSRVDRMTGALQTWPQSGSGELLVYKNEELPVLPEDAVPFEMPSFRKLSSVPGKLHSPDAMAVAANNGKIYIGSYLLGKIYILNGESGQVLDELICPGVRGLAFDASGKLWAASYLADKSEILCFTPGVKIGVPVITADLDAPYAVAVGKNGNIYVSDLGKSQQIKEFSTDGKLLKCLGRKGGRPWQGQFDPKDKTFLMPAGLALDGQGNVLVAEASPPKIISRVDVSNGDILNRWYGPGVYWNSTWPMPDDPRHIFYMINDGVARSRLGKDSVCIPDAYWQMDRAGYSDIHLEANIPQPEVVSGKNNRLYYVEDADAHAILVFEKDSTLRPVATWKGSKNTNDNALNIWIDINGDGKKERSEETVINKLADGSPLPKVAFQTASMHMENSGDLYFSTMDNCILKIPAIQMQANGVIRWDVKAAKLAIKQIIPDAAKMVAGWRTGCLGVRLDKAGNIYAVVNTTLSGKGGSDDYSNSDMAKSKLEGLGHTAQFNFVKYIKFSPAGKRLWMAGQKATAGAIPGEIYHFWNMAGLIGDDYVAGGSEWGVISFYTSDGFYVDSIMKNPADTPEIGPYTFSGETSGGRVAYFPGTGEVWAYSSGMAYIVNGFKDGKVISESRAHGSVTLDKIYDRADPKTKTLPIVMAQMEGLPIADVHAWDDVPIATLSKNGSPFAKAQIGYNKDFLYARIEVTDSTPMINGTLEGEEALVFKNGDTAGLILGPVRNSNDLGIGDVRILAVKIQGKHRLIAMKPMTENPTKKAMDYYTPAGGRVNFAFVGEVPGAQIDMKIFEGRYVVTFAVPRSFLEFSLQSGVALRGDIEIRSSGGGQRGLQTVGRNYYFTSQKSETSMVDDTPTEARFFPEYWGRVEVR